MLTSKQNLYEVMHGGNPDHFVEGFEPFCHFFSPAMTAGGFIQKGEIEHIDRWGVTWTFPDNVPGGMPVHTPDKVVIKDITHWQDYVKAPTVDFTDEQWEESLKAIADVDPEQQYIMPQVAPGLWEMCHTLGGLEQTMMNLYLEPEHMHDLIKYLTDFELRLAESLCDHLKVGALFHHDDIGSQISTMMSPDMFGEFFVDAYKEIYGYYRSRGVELIVHHSDSYGVTFVPLFIDMGIDIWQGCLSTNDIPSLIKQYGGKMTFMGAMDNGKLDRPGITDEEIQKYVDETLDACGPKYFIPCLTAGKRSIYDTYPRVNAAVRKYSEKYFANKK